MLAYSTVFSVAAALSKSPDDSADAFTVALASSASAWLWSLRCVVLFGGPPAFGPPPLNKAVRLASSVLLPSAGELTRPYAWRSCQPSTSRVGGGRAGKRAWSLAVALKAWPAKPPPLAFEGPSATANATKRSVVSCSSIFLRASQRVDISWSRARSCWQDSRYGNSNA